MVFDNSLTFVGNSFHLFRSRNVLPLVKRSRKRVAAGTCCISASDRLPLLEMRNIYYEAPRNHDLKVFRDMNFEVYPNEFVILIGHNGSGKTTALNIISGLEKPLKGDLIWKGVKKKPSKMLEHVGIVMQNPSFYFFYPTVLKELVAGREKSPDDVRRVLTAVGLTDISLMANPASLSGGQIRRLAVASQLLRDPLPSLFVMDEPLAGVDWVSRRDIVELLGSLRKQFAIVIVTHEPGDILEFADRVVEVRSGKMHNIDPEIVRRAINVRTRLRSEQRDKAIYEAMLYNQRKAFTEQSE